MTGAKASDWPQRVPFTDGVPIPYEATFTSAELAAIRRGFVPCEMENKWFIYFDEPFLFLHRSWTGKPVYRLEFQILPEGARVREALLHTGQATSAPEYAAALLGFLIDNLLLGRSRPFPLLATESVPGVEQHAWSGTGYAQLLFETGEPAPNFAPELFPTRRPGWLQRGLFRFRFRRFFRRRIRPD